MKFKFVKILILAACCIAAARFCHHQTQGFRMSKIAENAIPGLLPQGELIPQQRFHFLGRGLQSFVFASEDGQYVLKLFNNRYQRKIFLFSLLGIKDRVQYYESKLQSTFNSYQIAFDEMKEQTGLVYMHLSPTDYLKERFILIDRLNIAHEIDPNKYGFLIQKRAQLVYPALQEYLQKQDLKGAERALASLIELFFWKSSHEIMDNDPLIRTNYGFLEGKAVQIDVGPLSKGKKEPLEVKKEMLRTTESLKCWLNTHAPELIPALDRELEHHLSYLE